MKIARKFLLEQANRFKFCNFFPGREDDRAQYLAEIAAALGRATSEDIVTSVVSEWLENFSERPTPADIHRMVSRYVAGVESFPDPNCERCGGEGWIIVERGGLSGADRCTCWRRPAMVSARRGAA